MADETRVVEAEAWRALRKAEVMAEVGFTPAEIDLGRYLFFVSAVPRHMAAPYLSSEAA